MPAASRPLFTSLATFWHLAAVLFTAVLATGKADAVEFSTAEAGGKKITVCRVNVLQERLQLFLHDKSGQPLKRFDTLETLMKSRGRKLVFAMNAGMFQPGFAPVGLFVSEGREASPLNTAAGEGNFFLKPNGVFALTAHGALVTETGSWPKIFAKVTLATQSGPMLVTGGRIHPGFNPASKNRHFRNGVGVPSPGVAVFAISEEPVTFHEFAACFRDTLKCPDALFLDGAVSSLYAPALDRNDRRAELGPILAVTEGTPPQPGQKDRSD